MRPIGYELRTTTNGKGDGVRTTRCFDIGETVMLVGVIDGLVAKTIPMQPRLPAISGFGTAVLGQR